MLESLCPDIAPHIVITPPLPLPSDQWDAYWICTLNNVPTQFDYYLTVPTQWYSLPPYEYYPSYAAVEEMLPSASWIVRMNESPVKYSSQLPQPQAGRAERNDVPEASFTVH